jgi:acyl carrier protein
MSAETLDGIKTELKEMIKERLDIDWREIGVTDDSALFDEAAWGIDSVDVLDIVLGIEERFGLSIKQDDAVKSHFESISTLAAYIQSRKGQADAVAT